MPSDWTDPSPGHLIVRIAARPEVQFQLAGRPHRTTLALFAVLCVQAVILAFLTTIGRSRLLTTAAVVHEPVMDVVFFPEVSGSGGGGGGGGNQLKAPPRRAEIPAPHPHIVVAPVPEIDPTPPPQFNIPVTTLAAIELPGAMLPPASLPGTAVGLGRGPGGGGGQGPGVGPGDGSGLGPGMNGGPYAPGTGGADPIPIYRAEPRYTAAAVTAHVSGEVWVECTVLPTGACVGARVIRSLDPRFGLDLEAIRAAEQWRFRPGRDKTGRAVPFLVSIAVEFRLR